MSVDKVTIDFGDSLVYRVVVDCRQLGYSMPFHFALWHEWINELINYTRNWILIESRKSEVENLFLFCFEI